MAKSVLYQLFGVGKVPKRYIAMLEKENILLRDEGLSMVLRYRKFRAPGAYYGRKVSLLVGSVVLTEKSFGCFRGSIIPPVFHVPISAEHLKGFNLGIDEKGRFQVVINAAEFQEGWEGTIDVRIPCEHPKSYMSRIEGMIGK